MREETPQRIFILDQIEEKKELRPDGRVTDH